MITGDCATTHFMTMNFRVWMHLIEGSGTCAFLPDCVHRGLIWVLKSPNISQDICECIKGGPLIGCVDALMVKLGMNVLGACSDVEITNNDDLLSTKSSLTPKNSSRKTR